MTQTEADFQKQVIQFARMHRWRVAHFRTSMNARGRYLTAVAADGAGFPDLVLVRLSRIIFAELKSEKGRTSPEQKAWLEDLERPGKVEVYLWKPSDWGKIVELIR